MLYVLRIGFPWRDMREPWKMKSGLHPAPLGEAGTGVKERPQGRFWMKPQRLYKQYPRPLGFDLASDEVSDYARVNALILMLSAFRTTFHFLPAVPLAIAMKSTKPALMAS
ncbi:hypothetical protein AA0488_0816 [Kozakia baliensis NRIC 0488]|nr:hypothetical protein AA0488_0816 [Kozakia baliensis NRIC 0488]